MEKGIREVKIDRREDESIRAVRLVFGPHHFVELVVKADGDVDFVLGATHHGFHANASEVGGTLETIINEVRQGHPDLRVD